MIKLTQSKREPPAAQAPPQPRTSPQPQPEPQPQPQPFRLDNRHALVTGGASGIGEATVKELVRAGAFVWVADVNLAAAEALAKSTGSAKAVALDVTSADSVAAAATHIDRLDILVNNAGIGHVGSIETTEHEDFDRLYNVNVRGVYMVTRAFLPLLLAHGDEHIGAIVNIGSVSGLVGIKQRFAYCTASTPSVPAPCSRHSSKAISKNSTSTIRKMCAPSSVPASPSAVSAGLRRSHPWCVIWPLTKLPLSPAPYSPSMADGPQPDRCDRFLPHRIPEAS
jgi:NADP-dependent 3-hydroxy acid dehydrogenase YdfG